jgi:hypothetical protein
MADITGFFADAIDNRGLSVTVAQASTADRFEGK